MNGLDGLWLMTRDRFDALVEAYTSFDIDQTKFEAFIERTSSPDGGADLFFADDGVARIPIVGTLTKTPDFFFTIMGGGNAVYGDIIRAVRAADDDEDITRIVLEIDSAGGAVAGFFDAATAIMGVKTPIEAQVTDMAASAAFGLAAATGHITVNNRMAMVGSVGIVTQQFVSENRVTITSTEAPKKAPDASTEEGVADIKAMLDSIHAEFVAVIAEGLGTTVEDVNKNFGRGAPVIAADALRVNMIEGINSEIVGDPAVAAKSEMTTMADTISLADLRANHSATYAEAVAEGVAQERDRVSAHLTYGTAAKRLDLAAKHITEGSPMTQTAQAEYMTAGTNAAESTNAEAEEPPETPPAPSGGGTPPGEADNAEAKDAATNSMFDDLTTEMGFDVPTKA